VILPVEVVALTLALYLPSCRSRSDFAILIDRELACLDDFRFQIFEVGIIELELPLECPLGDPSMALQEYQDLLEYFVELHPHPRLVCKTYAGPLWNVCYPTAAHYMPQ
jgi:hypothetical protein